MIVALRVCCLSNCEHAGAQGDQVHWQSTTGGGVGVGSVTGAVTGEVSEESDPGLAAGTAAFTLVEESESEESTPVRLPICRSEKLLCRPAPSRLRE